MLFYLDYIDITKGEHISKALLFHKFIISTEVIGSTVVSKKKYILLEVKKKTKKSMRINPIASTMFLLSAMAMSSRNTVSGFSTVTKNNHHAILKRGFRTTSASLLAMNAEKPAGGKFLMLFISISYHILYYDNWNF